MTLQGLIRAFSLDASGFSQVFCLTLPIYMVEWSHRGSSRKPSKRRILMDEKDKLAEKFNDLWKEAQTNSTIRNREKLLNELWRVRANLLAEGVYNI